MGLFKGAKDAAANAAQMASTMGAGAGMNMPQGMAMGNMPDPAYVQMVNKIGQSGVEAPGELHAIRANGQPDMSGAVMHDLDVTITPGGQQPYDTTIHQSLLPQQLQNLTAGRKVTVKYDPDNPTNALLHSW